eukprot:2825135-Amphidinium_carterae.1
MAAVSQCWEAIQLAGLEAKNDHEIGGDRCQIVGWSRIAANDTLERNNTAGEKRHGRKLTRWNYPRNGLHKMIKKLEIPDQTARIGKLQILKDDPF